MKTKIQLKTIFEDLIFELEKEDNSILETVKEYIEKEKADGKSGANLYGANLYGANLYGNKIKCFAFFNGLYRYYVLAYITDKDEKRINMGCHDRSLKEWEENFWNNPDEFPNDNSKKSNLRIFAFETAKRWFDVIKHD